MSLSSNEEYKRCSICHSIIGVHNTFNSNFDRDLTTEEIEALEAQGIYLWSHDPIKTYRGLAGDDYKGLLDITWQQIQELQEARNLQEVDAGLTPTDFSEITSKIDSNKKHIRELRQSTENILETFGLTLEDYFNNDEEGNYLGTQEYEIDKPDKTEWKRVNRIDNIPYLPITVSDIYALDIEELRCPLLLGWIETFDKTIENPSAYIEIPSGSLGEVVESYQTFDHKWYTSLQTTRDMCYNGSEWVPSPGTYFAGWEILNSSNKKLRLYGRITGKASPASAISRVFYGEDYESYTKNFKMRPNIKIQTSGIVTALSNFTPPNITASAIKLELFVKNSETHQVYGISYIQGGYAVAGEISVINITNLNRNLLSDFQTKYPLLTEEIWKKTYIQLISLFGLVSSNSSYPNECADRPIQDMQYDVTFDYIRLR